MASPRLLITLLSVFTLTTLTTLLDIIPKITLPALLIFLAFIISSFSLITYLTLEIAAEVRPPSHHTQLLEKALRWQRFFNEEAHGLLLLVMACFAWFWTVATMFAVLVFTALFREETTFGRLCGLLASYIPLVGTAIALFVYWGTALVFVVIFGFVVYTAGRSGRRLYHSRGSGFVENGVLLGRDEGAVVSNREDVIHEEEEEEDGDFGAWKGNQGSA